MIFVCFFFDLMLYKFGAFCFDVSFTCDVCVDVAWIVQWTISQNALTNVCSFSCFVDRVFDKCLNSFWFFLLFSLGVPFLMIFWCILATKMEAKNPTRRHISDTWRPKVPKWRPSGPKRLQNDAQRLPRLPKMVSKWTKMMPKGCPRHTKWCPWCPMAPQGTRKRAQIHQNDAQMVPQERKMMLMVPEGDPSWRERNRHEQLDPNPARTTANPTPASELLRGSRRPSSVNFQVHVGHRFKFFLLFVTFWA